MRLLPADLVIASALVSVAAGCAAAPPQDTTAADTTAINAVRAAWVTALNAADPDGLANLYTEGAVRMVSGSPTVTGRSAIRQDFTDRFTMGTMTISPSCADDGSWQLARTIDNSPTPGP